MNLGQLRTIVRTYIQEPTASFWTDAELNGFLNEADIEVLKQIQGGDPFRTNTTVIGQATYVLPDYVLELNDVLYGTTYKRLEPMQMLPEELSTTNGTPTRYMIPRNGKTIILDPPPSTLGTTIKLCGRFKTADMSGDSDVPESPSILHSALVHYASSLAWHKRKDSEQAANAMKLYQLIMLNWDGNPDVTAPKRIIRGHLYR